MSKTRRSVEKEKRNWNDLLNEKKSWLQRQIEDRESKKTLRDFELERKLREMYPEDPPF